MKLIGFLELFWVCVSIRTRNVDGNPPGTVVFDMEFVLDKKLDTLGRGGRQSTHHTAFRVEGSVSGNIMRDDHNVKEILDQILRIGEFDTKKHLSKIAKVRESDDQEFFLCEWTSDVSKAAFAKAYEWNETQYTVLNQWVYSNLQPKIAGTSPSGEDTTIDMDKSHFEILAIKPFEWDNRPKQYRMVAIKVTGSKRKDVIEHSGLKKLLEHVLVDTSNPDHPQIEIQKTAQDDADENTVRVGLVTKMTEAEINNKFTDFNYGPLNNWARENFPKEISDDGTTVASTVIELKIFKLKTDFESDWYIEYNANPGRGGLNTHLTAFGVRGTLSEKVMLDKTKMKELVEQIITTEGHRIENNVVTVMKLEKSNNAQFILCEWTSDLSKETFEKVFHWTAAQHAELNKWARQNLYRHDHNVIVARFPMTSGMTALEFEIFKMEHFQWDLRDEGLQMVSIKVTGTERSKVVSADGLKILLQHALTDESDPNYPNIEIWKTVQSESDPNVQRVAFITKITTAEINTKLKLFDYNPFNEWAKKKFTDNNTVFELKIIKIQDDFELKWYEQWLRE